MSYIFVLITSNTCSACITFKEQHLNKLLEKLKSINDLSVLHINLLNRDVNSLNQSNLKYIKGANLGLHPKFVKTVSWYPQFFIFSKNDWLNTSGNLKGYTFNGTITEEGTSVRSSNGQPHNADNLYEWCKNIIGEKNQGIPVNNQGKSTINQIMPGYLQPSKYKFKFSPNKDD